MPTLGTTAPATTAGCLVVGDAEVISGIVLSSSPSRARRSSTRS
jgi:trimethylamine:corrinoid methyltransferase-like protein